MALNLGDINFGLGVDTRRLNSSVNDVVKFGRAVDTAASRSSAASKKAAADLRRQEKAALAALQQTLRFNDSVRKAGAPTRLLTDSAKAFKQYTSAVTSGKLATLDFQRAQSKFQADMGRSARSLNRFKADADKASGGILGLSGNMSNLSNAATLAVGPLSGIGARITALTSIANRSNLAMVGLIAGITGAGVVIGKFSQGAVTTAIQLDKVDARLLAVTGSTTAAAAAFEEIRALADATGTELISVANGYAKIAAASQGTALEGAAAAQVFEDVLFGAAQFRIGQEELNGVLKAFEQIMSKGIVQSEELRGQLGDRLVGAFNIAAQSMGVTTEELNKMLKAGEVVSDEFLPKFAAAFREAVGADQVRRVEGLQASMNRFANSQTNFNQAFDETFGISKLFEASVISLTNVIDFFANNMEVLGLATAAATGALLVLAGPRILSGLVFMGRAIKTATVFMFGFNTAIMANPLGGFLTIITRVGAALVGAAVGFGLASSAMANADTQQQRLIDTVDEYIAAQKRQQTTAAETTTALREQLDQQIADVRSRLDSMQVRIPTGLSFENDDRNGIQRFLDDLPRRTSMQLGMGDPNTIDYLERQEQIRAVQAELDALIAKQTELTDIERAQLAVLAQRVAAEQAVISSAEQGAIQQIARINAEAAAMGLGIGAVQALKAEFQQADVITRFGENLTKAGVEAEIVQQRVNEFAAALAGLQETKVDAVLEQTATQIDRIRQEIEAMGQGATAVEALKQSFATADAVTAFRDRLVAAGTEMEIVEARTAAFRQAMIDLDETVRAQNTANVISEITAEIDRMNAEAVALQEGEAAVRALKQQFDNTQTIDTFRQRLEDAGVTGSRLEGIINALTGALFRLQSVAGQVQIDAAIDSAASATNRLQRETEALAGGKDAFTAFQNAERVTANLAQLEQTLRDAGAGEDAITSQLETRRAALESNIAANARYQAALAASRGSGGGSRGGKTDADREAEALAKFTEQLAAFKVLQDSVALGADALRIIQSDVSPAEAVKAYAASLQGAGLSQEELNTKLDAFRERAQAYQNAQVSIDAMNEALGVANGMVSDLLERSELLQNIDLSDLMRGREAAESVAQYRMALKALGYTQEETNQAIREYLELLDQVTDQEEALDLITKTQDIIKQGWEDVAQSLADSIMSGKLNLESLADIGKQVTSQLLASFLELAVIKPLLNSIFGAFGMSSPAGGSSFGELFSGAGGNVFGTLFSRKGNAFGSDGPMSVNYARKGALLTGPTAFGTQDGGLTIGGEAGDEGILPLARDAAGDLGVIVAGGQGGNTINFNFPPGTDASSFQKSESQMAAVASRVAQRGGRNQ